MLCAFNLMHEWNVHSGQQIFWKNFSGNYISSLSFCHESAEEICFHISLATMVLGFCCLKWELIGNWNLWLPNIFLTWAKSTQNFAWLFYITTPYVSFSCSMFLWKENYNFSLFKRSSIKRKLNFEFVGC